MRAFADILKLSEYIHVENVLGCLCLLLAVLLAAVLLSNP